jgi:hypothetical protein
MSENIGDREAEKSKQGQSRKTEDIIYDIVAQYNGVVEKLLEATQPDGKYSNRRLASSSNLNYLSGLLHQIDDPLKELVYMLTSAQDPELTTLLNMLTNMVQVIDSSPPFQKIDVFAYKNGPPDFQGVNSKLIINPKGYAADLEKYAKKMQLIKDKYGKQIKATLFNIPDTPSGLKIREQYYQQAVTRYEQMQNVVRKIDDEIIKARELAALSPAEQQDVTLDKDTLKEIKSVVNKFATSGLPVVGDTISLEQIRANIAAANAIAPKAYVPRPYGQNRVKPAMSVDAGSPAPAPAPVIQTQPAPPPILSKQEELSEALRETLDAADEGYQEFYNRGVFREGMDKERYRDIRQAAFTAIRGIYQRLMPLLLESTPRNMVLPRPFGTNVRDETLRNALNDYVAGLFGSLTGKGKPKYKGGVGKVADYLSNAPQQQHTRMGRPVSNDDDIQRQMIASNKNWQSKSNPVHTTSIGSLNPFIEKSEESKYLFPKLLYKELSKTRPQRNALGADVSLLQGPIGGPTKYAKEPKKPSRVQQVSQTIATDNILEGRGKGNRRNKGALHKLVFMDEKNEMFD